MELSGLLTSPLARHAATACVLLSTLGTALVTGAVTFVTVPPAALVASLSGLVPVVEAPDGRLPPPPVPPGVPFVPVVPVPELLLPPPDPPPEVACRFFLALAFAVAAYLSVELLGARTVPPEALVGTAV